MFDYLCLLSFCTLIGFNDLFVGNDRDVLVIFHIKGKLKALVCLKMYSNNKINMNKFSPRGPKLFFFLIKV